MRRSLRQLLAPHGADQAKRRRGPPCLQGLSEVEPALSSGPKNIAQCHGLAGELRTDGAAQKFTLVKQADFRHVPRVLSQQHGFSDIRGKQRINVPHALKPNAVGPYDACPGHGEQQQIELLQRVWHSWQKAVLPPALLRRKFRFTVRLCVISAQEFTEALIKVRERERGLAAHGASVDVSWQSAEEHLIDGPKKRSILPRPRGRPGAEKIRRILISAATCSRCIEVKSLPLSV